MDIRKFKEYIPFTAAYKARVAGNLAVASFSYEDYVRQQPHGPGLLSIDVNWNLYREGYRGTERHSSQQHLDGRSEDFRDTQLHLLQQYLELPSLRDVPLSSQIRSGPTGELSHFLGRHRFRNAFFTPEMIQEAVADVPEVTVDHGEADGVKVWNFTALNEVGDTERLTLVRADENPTVRTAPYLAVTYTAEYDPENQDIQFVPRPIMDRMDGINGSLPRGNSVLNNYIVSALGLETQILHQPLSFTVDDSPMRFLTLSESGSASAPAEQGSVVMGQIDLPGRVVIDLA